MRIAAAVAVACLSIATVSIAENAEAAMRRPTHIPEQPLDSALQALAKERNLQMIYPYEIVGQLRTRGANGDLTFEEAIASLLSGTGLAYRYLDEKTVTIVPLATAPSAASGVDGAMRGTSAAVDAVGGTQGAGEVAPRRWYGWLTLAQAADPRAAHDANAVDEIVVTAQRKFRPEVSNAASKFELPIIETPQALTVLSSEFLNIARLNDTASVVAYAPGVELRGMGDGTQAALVARGFTVNRERGFRINGLSTDSELDLDYFAMDRVEIVRGPASSLYGEADYGATFNRVLKKPAGKFGANAALGFGSYDLKRLQGDVQGTFGASDIASWRAVAAVQDSGTFIRDTEDDRVLISPSLRFKLDRTDILVQAYHQKMTGATSDGFPMLVDFSNGALTLPKLPRRNNYGADINRIDSENQFVFSSVDHRLGDSLSLSLKGGYSRIRMNNVSSYLFLAGLDGNATLYGYPEDKTKEDLSFDASVEKRFEMGGREHRFLLSADWRQNDYFQDIYTEPALGTINVFEGGPLHVDAASAPQAIPGEFFSSQQFFSGVTGLAHLKPTDRLSLLLGLRYSRIKTSDWDHAPIRYGLDSRITGLKDDAWVPRAALVYRIREGHNVYLSYSEGIIFNQSFLDANGAPVNPETGVQYEIGLKGELFDRRLMYSAAVFEITRTDVAAALPVGPGEQPVFHNVGKQIHRGGEIEVVGEPIPGLNVVASYSNLDIDIRESANPLEIGQAPVASPANSYSLFTTYELLSGPLRTLTFGGGLVGRSEREADAIGSFQLPSYTRVDLRASYNVSEALLLELNLQNVFNERIYTSVYGSPYFGIAQAYPRTAFGRVSYRW